MSNFTIYHNTDVTDWATGTRTNISSYYLSPGLYPRYQMNEDCSPIVTNAKFSFTENIPITFNIGEGISVLDGEYFSSFIIRKKTFDFTRKIYTVECENVLCRLNDKYIFSSDIYDDLLDGISVAPTDNQAKFQDNRWTGGPSPDYSNYQVLWVLQIMFEKCDLTLTLTDKSEIALAYSGTNYNFEHICIDWGMFYNINQNPTVIWSQAKNDSLVSYFDFLQAFCSLFGCIVYQIGEKQFELLAKGSLYDYTPSDDIILDKIESEEQRKYATAATADHFWTADNSEYYGTGGYSADVNLNTNYGAKTNFNWYANLLFMLRDLAGSDGDVITGVYIGPFTNSSGIVFFPIKEAIEKDFIEYEWLFPYNATGVLQRHNAISLDFDMQENVIRLKRRVESV